MVGGEDIFADRRSDDLRQPLAAIFLGRGKRRPAGFAELPVRLLEAGRSSDRAVVGPLAAHFVADPVQGLEHFLAEAAGLLENGRDQVGRGVGEARQVGIAADVEHIFEDEARLSLPARRRSASAYLRVSIVLFRTPRGRPAPVNVSRSGH